MTKFKKGELAIRYLLNKNLRIVGSELITITDIYSDYKSKFGPYPELYEITTPKGNIHRGYLPHGLIKLEDD